MRDIDVYALWTSNYSTLKNTFRELQFYLRHCNSTWVLIFNKFDCGLPLFPMMGNIYIIIFIFTNPSTQAGYDTRSIFKRSLTGWNSEFSFSYTSCPTKAEEFSLPYNLPVAGGRIVGFIPFLRVLVLCEMLSVSSRILTRIAVSISYDDNHYTTGTSTSI